jgi:hypothetical protein
MSIVLTKYHGLKINFEIRTLNHRLQMNGNYALLNYNYYCMFVTNSYIILMLYYSCTN